MNKFPLQLSLPFKNSSENLQLIILIKFFRIKVSDDDVKLDSKLNSNTNSNIYSFEIQKVRSSTLKSQAIDFDQSEKTSNKPIQWTALKRRTKSEPSQDHKIMKSKIQHYFDYLRPSSNHKFDKFLTSQQNNLSEDSSTFDQTSLEINRSPRSSKNKMTLPTTPTYDNSRWIPIILKT